MKHDDTTLKLIADIKATEAAIKALRFRKGKRVKRADKRQARLKELCA